jgi:hypothetical protein
MEVSVMKIEIEVSDEAYGHLLMVVDAANMNDPDATTHGTLTVARLFDMLAQDLVMTNTRPGSWEGSNMQQVLDSHGYR